MNRSELDQRLNQNRRRSSAPVRYYPRPSSQPKRSTRRLVKKQRKPSFKMRLLAKWYRFLAMVELAFWVVLALGVAVLGLWVWGVWDDYKRSDDDFSNIQIVTSEPTNYGGGEDTEVVGDGWVISEEPIRVLTTGTPRPTPTLRATATAVNAVSTVAVTPIYATPESVESGLLNTLTDAVEDVGEGLENTFSLPDSSTDDQHPIIQDGISEAACYEGRAAGRRVSPACAQFFAGANGGTGR